MTTTTHRPPAETSAASQAARTSLRLLWWIPLSPLVGFVAASWFLADDWPLWQVLPLELVLAAPFAIGALLGLRAIRLGDKRGWIGAVLHVTFLVVALVLPITESVTA
jgi:hypothetical protein